MAPGRDPTPAELGDTRRSWHVLAEHLVAADRHRATGRIGLQPAPGGFGSTWYPTVDPDTERRILVVGDRVVVEERTEAGGDHGREGHRREVPITTLAEVAAATGVEAGAPSAVYPPATPGDLDAPLPVHAGAAATLARFFAEVDRALQLLRRDVDGGRGTPEHAITLWPEHFDLAMTADRVNYGGSPGDDDHPQPYLYVGPWEAPEPDGGFWNEPFGASRLDAGRVTADEALAFFREGRARSRARRPG